MSITMRGESPATRPFRFRLWISFLLGLLASAAAGAQTTYELVHVFHSSGGPSKLIRGTDGYLYGTTLGGGTSGFGTIFRLDPDGKLATVHSFAGADGANPAGGLIQSADGSFYGTTTLGGKYNRGTVFRMDPSFHVTVLHSFSGPDGSGPSAAPSQTVDGNIYGTTVHGGASDMGTVYGIIDGIFTTLHNFQGDDGGHVRSPLLDVGYGALLGTTTYGGWDGSGSIFYVDRYGNFETLYSFSWLDPGYVPVAGLTQGYDAIYGTTTWGGEYGQGIVFRFDGQVTAVSSVEGGGSIAAELVQGTDGYLYGTTPNGGPTSSGTIIRVSPAGDTTVLHTFHDEDGVIPSTALYRTEDGALYGATATGDNWRWAGSIFRLNEPGDLETLHIFRGEDAVSPEATLIEAADGRVFGTALGGTYNRGVVFSLDAANSFNVVHSFHGSDGAYPRAALIQTSDGNFLGTTSSGGANDLGTVFRMHSSGELTVLHSFDGPNGQEPYAPLVQFSDDSLYSTTTSGGAQGLGTVFRIDPKDSFSLVDSLFAEDGGYPLALLPGEGCLYGTATSGGLHSLGTVFRVDSSGAVSPVHTFSGPPDGTGPMGGMIRALDRNAYGVTYAGGEHDQGTVYRMNPNGEVSTFHSFDGEHGRRPLAGLILAGDGNFYGTTSEGGTGAGTIFRLGADGNITTLHRFHTIDGTTPAYASLLQASDGRIYGTTLLGGPINGEGVVFRLGFSEVAVNRITPASGDAAGGIALNLLGGGFAPTSTVEIGGEAETDITVLDPTFLYLFSPALPPGTLNDVSVTIPGATGDTVSAELSNAFFADFLDVPQTEPFHAYVEMLVRSGVTAGCGGGNYCPKNAVTRAQMAVFLLKSKHGATYTPPPCQSRFADVACPSLFADWIEQLAAEGITAGCGGGNYCPYSPVTRAQMAVFLLKAIHGSTFDPPNCADVFGDVPCPSLFADWIEELAAEGITAGCGDGNYCPDNPNTRAQMAAFLVKAIGM